MEMLPPTVVVKPRRIGRPSVSNGDVPPADVHLRVAPEDYDRIGQIASRERVSIGDVIRRAIKKIIEDERG